MPPHWSSVSANLIEFDIAIPSVNWRTRSLLGETMFDYERREPSGVIRRYREDIETLPARTSSWSAH